MGILDINVVQAIEEYDTSVDTITRLAVAATRDFGHKQAEVYTLNNRVMVRITAEDLLNLDDAHRLAEWLWHAGLQIMRPIYAGQLTQFILIGAASTLFSQGLPLEVRIAKDPLPTTHYGCALVDDLKQREAVQE